MCKVNDDVRESLFWPFVLIQHWNKCFIYNEPSIKFYFPVLYLKNCSVIRYSFFVVKYMSNQNTYSHLNLFHASCFNQNRHRHRRVKLDFLPSKSHCSEIPRGLIARQILTVTRTPAGRLVCRGVKQQSKAPPWYEALCLSGQRGVSGWEKSKIPPPWYEALCPSGQGGV